MTLAIPLLATLLHAALMAAAIPALAALTAAVRTSWRGEPRPPPLQPWRDLARLWRKRAPHPGHASLVFAAAPAASIAAATAAIVLLPSFTLGTATAGLADLPLLAALLAAARGCLALAAHDSGAAALAHHMPRLGATPVILLAALALALLSGGTGLEAAVATIRDGGLAAHLAGFLAGMALLGVAAATPARPHAYGGRHAALAEAAAQAVFLAGLAAAAAIALPFGTASTPAGWAPGIAAWLAKLAALAVLALALRGQRLVLPAAALLAMAAVAIASVQARA